MTTAQLTNRTRPRKRKRGPYIVLIETAVGWSQSRRQFPRLKLAKRSALWFANLQGVWQARIIDLNTAGDAPRVVDIFKHHNRKPR